MTAKTDEPDESLDAESFRYALARHIQRFIADNLQLWAACENRACRRAKRCASREDCQAVEKWSESLPPGTPEQERAQLIEFKKALTIRISLGEDCTLEKLSEAIEKEKAERRAAMPWEESDMPAPGVEGTKLAPEQEPINGARNDAVEEQERTREPGPRIARL